MSEVPIDPALLSLIKETQSLLSYISKPKLTDKYLSKPPLRFLMDVVKACAEETGFPKGLWSAEMIANAEAKEAPREAKLLVLDRLITCVSLTNGSVIAAKSIKIIAGLEPENTNLLLQEMAKAALVIQSGAKSLQEIISRIDAGETSLLVPIVNQPATSIPEVQHAPPQASSSASPVAPIVDPIQSTLENVLSSNPADCPSWIVDTQKALQMFFDKPKLMAKNLMKPPFAFLHDIIIAIMKNTGFFEGLFTETELDRELLKESKVRAIFLKKVSDVVYIVLNKAPPANIAKILAGAEPENTNALLQDIALAVNSGVRFQDALDALRNSNATTVAKEVPKEAAKEVPVQKEKEDSALKRQQSREREITKEVAKEVVSEVKSEIKDTEEVEKSKAFERPRTAKRAPPKIKSNLEEEPVKNKPVNEDRIDKEEPAHISAGGVLLDTDVVEEEEEEDVGEDVRNDRADEELEGGGGKLKRDIAKSLAETKKSKKIDKPSVVTANGSITFSNKLGVKASDKSVASKTDMKKANEQLRDWIQQLCQSVNPLGKCVDFVHEDMEIMTRELARWQREYQGQLELFSQEQKKTEEVLYPLKKQLEDLERSYRDQKSQLMFLNATILRNETQIRQTLDIQAQGMKL